MAFPCKCVYNHEICDESWILYFDWRVCAARGEQKTAKIKARFKSGLGRVHNNLHYTPVL